MSYECMLFFRTAGCTFSLACYAARVQAYIYSIYRVQYHYVLQSYREMLNSSDEDFRDYRPNNELYLPYVVTYEA